MLSQELIGIISLLIAGLGVWFVYKDRRDRTRAQRPVPLTMNYAREAQHAQREIVLGDAVDVKFSLQNCSAHLFQANVSEVLPFGTKLVAGDIGWSGKLLPGHTGSFEYTIQVEREGLLTFGEPVVKLDKHIGYTLTMQCDGNLSILVRPFTPAQLNVTARISETPIVIGRPFCITLLWQNLGGEHIANVSYRIEYDVEMLSVLEGASDFTLSFALDRHSEVKHTLAFTSSEIGEMDIRLTGIRYQSVNGAAKGVADHPIHVNVGLGWQLILVDRIIEMRRIRDRIDNLKNGQGHFTILEGETGIGKSHLIGLLTRYARDKGFQCYLTACMEFSSSLPFHPLRQFLDELLSMAGKDSILSGGAYNGSEPLIIPEMLKPYIAVLSNYLVGVSLSDQEQVRPVIEAGELRGQFLIALCKLLEVLARRKPIVLCIEDLQWADSGTLDALLYLTTRLHDKALYIIGTLRSEVLYDDSSESDRAPLKTLLAVRRHDVCEVMRLAPFSIQEVTELLDRVFYPSELSPRFAASIYEETDGNPFYIHELVQLMLKQGVLHRRSEDGVWIADELVKQDVVPDTIDHAITARLASLSDTEMQCLENAAVIGRQFDYLAMEQLTGLDEDALITIIDKYIGMRIMEETDEANRRYRFSHNKTCEVIYQGITPTRRRKMHKQLAIVLEEIHSGSLSSVSAIIANHYLKAQELGLAVRYLLLAGKENLRVFSNREAIRYLKSALDALSAADEEDIRLRKEILVELATAYREDNDFANAEKVYDAVMAIARETDDIDLMCILLSRKAEANAIQGNYDIAEEAYDEFGSLLDVVHDERKELLLLNDQADLYYWLYKKYIVEKNISLARSYRDKIYQCASSAINLSKRLKDLDAEVRSAKNIGVYYLIMQDYPQATKRFDDATRLAEGHELLQSQYVYAFAGLAHRLMGNYDDAVDNYNKYLSWAERIGAHWARSKAHQILGLLAYLRGDFADALIELNKALELNSVVRAKHEDIETLAIKGQVLESLGREDDALECYRTSLELRGTAGTNVNEYSSIMLGIGLEMYARGEIDQSRKFVERATKGVAGVSIDHGVRTIMTELGMFEC